MANMRAQAQLFYDGTGAQTFGAANLLCTAGMFADSSMTALVAGVTAQATAVACTSSGQSWAMAATLKGTGFWCVDSTGVARSKNSANASYTVLTGAAATAALDNTVATNVCK
jgi:hypothetical protein